jgi:hypothetical protein
MYRYNQYATKYLSSSFIFKDSIERVFEVYRNPQCMEKAFEKYNLTIYSLRNPSDKFDCLNASFIYCFINSNIRDEFTVESIVNDENRKMIQLQAKNIFPFNYSYKIRLSFYWCNIMNQTVFSEEVFLYQTKIDSYLNDMFNTYQLQMKTRCKIVEKFLKEFTFNLTQFESIIINEDFNIICKYIRHFKLFAKFAPSIANKVIVKGDSSQVGCEIVLYNEQDRNNLKLIRNEIIDDKLFYELEYINKGYSEKIPKQLVKFMLIKIKDDQTFISFVHEFIDPIRFSTISKMNKNKQRILQEFKTNTEKRKIRFH